MVVENLGSPNTGCAQALLSAEAGLAIDSRIEREGGEAVGTSARDSEMSWQFTYRKTWWVVSTRTLFVVAWASLT